MAAIGLSVSPLIISNAMCADNKDIAIYEHRVSHRIQGSSPFLFVFSDVVTNDGSATFL